VPTPLGGGGLIAVSARIENNWDIYAIEVATGARTRLTADPAEDRSPAFSPDGQTVAYASQRDGHWNLYARTPDGTVAQWTNDPAYDGAPAWSPDGAQIAFESMRDGDLDIWVMDLASGVPVNLTADSPAVECAPVWSPDGAQIAFTSYRHGDADIFALDLGTGDLRQLTSSPAEERLAAWGADGELLYTSFEGERQEIYRRTVKGAPEQQAERLTRWLYADAPARSPDGTYVAFLYRRTHGAQVYLQRPGVSGDLPVRLTEALPARGPLSWTGTIAAWSEAKGAPVELYAEDTSPGDGTPYDLQRLDGIDVGNPWLSDRVDDSFWALKARIRDETGHDFLAHLSDAWRAVSYYSEGSSYTSWHKAGRAIDTLVDYLSPDRQQRWLEVVLEPGGGETYWRLYLRCAAQDGSQGAPLTDRPWDATADGRRNGEGGRRKAIPNGYYVDLTDLMAQYGWLRIAAHDHPDYHWHTNFVALEYWHFQKTEDLLWYEAMLELFAPEVIEMHHSWEVQQLKGTPLWLAWAKGIPLPWRERRLLEMIAP
jgi:TolB protein